MHRINVIVQQTGIRVLKGLRAPGLPPKKCRATRRKIRGSRTPLLHSRAPFSQKQHFCSGSKSREALGSGLHDKNFRAPGLQRPPFGTLRNAKRHSTRTKPICCFFARFSTSVYKRDFGVPPCTEQSFRWRCCKQRRRISVRGSSGHRPSLYCA